MCGVGHSTLRLDFLPLRPAIPSNMGRQALVGASRYRPQALLSHSRHDSVWSEAAATAGLARILFLETGPLEASQKRPFAPIIPLPLRWRGQTQGEFGPPSSIGPPLQ